MPQIDCQWGYVDEVTVGTPVVVTKFGEYASEGIDFKPGRIDSEPLRAGQHGEREDRWTPYADEQSGTVTFDVLTKSFAFFLKHMLGTVATTGPVETVVYTHTGTVGPLSGDSFTCQFNRPFAITGNQALTLAGTKIKSWKLSNSIPGNLVAEFEVDAMTYSTATALATASYPTLMDNFTFVGAAVTIGGSAFDASEFSVSMDNHLLTTERRKFGNVRKEAAVSGQRNCEWALKGDWDNLTQFNRVVSLTRAGALASIVATWTGPILAGSTLFPKLTVTIPSARFDTVAFPSEGYDPIDQELTGLGLDPVGGASSITIAVATTETTP